VSVAAHVVAPAFALTLRRWHAGDHAGALAAFRTAIPAIEAINGAGQQAPTAKAALELLGVLPNRSTRLPITPLDDDEVAALRAALVRAGVLGAATA